ncbi:MAG: transcriptional regulator, HxlR family [Solirubrobacterales bacterium]|nr:transcriptional regulator, HxlR family [Solirubrobacterales bacterium]
MQPVRLRSSQMLGSDYPAQVCSVARALEVVGERWTLLILRDVFLGVRRFEDIQRDLGIARNVLASRLEGLVERGVLAKRAYQERPPRHEYVLTDKGRDLWPVVNALMVWGDQHAPTAEGPPTVLTHHGCGGELDADRVCRSCGVRATSIRDVRAVAGPGARPGHPLLVAAGEAGPRPDGPASDAGPSG